MLSVIGGLWVMSRHGPLAAQAGHLVPHEPLVSAATVTPGGTVTVTMTITVANWRGQFIRVVRDVCPHGFSYIRIRVVTESNQAARSRPDGQVILRPCKGMASEFHLCDHGSQHGRYPYLQWYQMIDVFSYWDMIVTGDSDSNGLGHGRRHDADA